MYIVDIHSRCDHDAADDDDVGDDDVDVLFCLVGLREKSKTDK